MSQEGKGQELGFWQNILKNHKDIKLAPLELFPHVPLSRRWKSIYKEDLVVEAVLYERPSKETTKTPWWIGNMIEFSGYFAKVKYLGFNDDEKHMHWVRLWDEIRQVGNPKSVNSINKRNLIPPLGLKDKFKDLREYIFKNIESKNTIANKETIASIIELKIDITRVMIGSTVEVLDKFCLSQLRLGEVDKAIGRRIHIKYWNEIRKEEDGFWCHELSDYVFPQGWCKTIGQKLSAPIGYNPGLIKNVESISGYDHTNIAEISIEVGMRFECIDPLSLHTITVGCVAEVLKFGYFMAFIESSREKMIDKVDGPGNDWFCFHIYSPNIFQCGWAEKQNIELDPPFAFKKKNLKFSWPSYLKKTHSKALPIPDYEFTYHDFKKGMKLEVVDPNDTSLICPGSIEQIHEHILKIRMDGWDPDLDIYIDHESSDLFPPGYCELVGYKLENIGQERPEIYMKSEPRSLKLIKQHGAVRKTTKNFRF